jgi:Bacterial protein of unknown function (DUF839)
MKRKIISIAIGLAVSSTAMATGPSDFGLGVDKYLNEHTHQYFGFKQPVWTSEKTTVSRVPNQSANQLIKLSKGLNAEIVTRKAANTSDMIAFWPNDVNPTHLITCIEDFREPADNIVGAYPGGQVKYGPSVQRTNLKTKAVETILRGMSSCDGIRRTPWNTIVATEERDDGGMYEILNPLAVSELTVVTRGTSDIIDSTGKPVTGQVEYRGALGNLAWEGLDLTQQGVVYYGDEERPGSGGADRDGGSIFKFVPNTPWDGKAIAQLDQSPLVSGNVYAYQASCQAKTSGSFPQFGQGCEVGDGAWLKVDPAGLRASASIISATGYYRPEDGHFDPSYKGPGVKFCWTNTGNASANNYGEVMCLIDTNPVGTGEKIVEDEGVNAQGLAYLADSNEAKGFAVATANRVLEGDTQLNQPDNLAFQPRTNNMYVIEDNAFGDVWACLPDGKDRDIKSDGCSRMLSVRDSSAEPTGFTFTADGKTAYVYIQHSNDAACIDGSDCAKNDDYATDDLIKITGFKIKK